MPNASREAKPRSFDPANKIVILRVGDIVGFKDRYVEYYIEPIADTSQSP